MCWNLAIPISTTDNDSWCSTKDDSLRDVTLLGRNGAALTALGDIDVDVDILDEDEPLEATRDGVKLGDSTFNRFLRT